MNKALSERRFQYTSKIKLWKKIILILILIITEASSLYAQEAISTDHFDGWENWTLYEPGDIVFDVPDEFGSLITWVDTRFGTGEVSTMRIDIIDDIYFKGESAFWIQHTGSGNQNVTDGSGTSTLDATLFDRKTFRVLYRIASQPGTRTWGGPYDITHHFPDKVVRVQVNENGSVKSDSLRVDNNNPFDFVLMPYMLAFMELQQGHKFRFLNIGGRTNLNPRPVGIYVKGKTNVNDTHGKEHEVWDVQLLSNSESLLVNFYITKEAPYFWGWTFRRITNGQIGSEWMYRDHHVIHNEL